MRVIQVQQFNQEAKARYNKAIDNFQGNGGFPFLPMYIFETPEGEPRQRGYVATEGNRHFFGMNKEEATANFNN